MDQPAGRDHQDVHLLMHQSRAPDPKARIYLRHIIHLYITCRGSRLIFQRGYDTFGEDYDSEIKINQSPMTHELNLSHKDVLIFFTCRGLLVPGRETVGRSIT